MFLERRKDPKELKELYPNASEATRRSLAVVDERIINYELLEALLEHLHGALALGPCSDLATRPSFLYT